MAQAFRQVTPAGRTDTTSGQNNRLPLIIQQPHFSLPRHRLRQARLAIKWFMQCKHNLATFPLRQRQPLDSMTSVSWNPQIKAE